LTDRMRATRQNARYAGLDARECPFLEPWRAAEAWQ
jgi:hypothetical protein